MEIKKGDRGMGITKEQIDICEELGWRVRIDSDGDIELENWSPAGEDLVFYVEKGDDFAKAVSRISEDFDVDEHVEPLVEIRGTRGVPSSVRVLVDDAYEIEKMLDELSMHLAISKGNSR